MLRWNVDNSKMSQGKSGQDNFSMA